MKMAQDYINGDGHAMAGFNRRVSGYTYNECFKYQNERVNGSLHAGWDKACEMINEGKIYFIHNFHQSHQGCKGFAFLYGGSWVCNTCEKSKLDKDWWAIKVYEDGDEWCCIGEDFKNLQESDCYAFGKSRQEAIKNYGDLYADKKILTEYEGDRE